MVNLVFNRKQNSKTTSQILKITKEYLNKIVFHIINVVTQLNKTTWLSTKLKVVGSNLSQIFNFFLNLALDIKKIKSKVLKPYSQRLFK